MLREIILEVICPATVAEAAAVTLFVFFLLVTGALVIGA